MFDLNKIIEVIKESGREIFLARENGDPFVIMSFSRYKELLKISNEKDSSISNIKEEDYPDYVKKTIMPEINE